MCEKVIVTVKEGKIRGVKESSAYSKAEFYSFYGIPYGQPPVKNLRFKDPVKIRPWKTIYDATKKKPGCTQFSLKTYQFLGDEDCLFNNIYTPTISAQDKPLRPVIVNIHPGGFMFGTPNPDHYGSTEFIMHHDIVYVCIAYRLHILGFLNLGIKECSGNQALKDIILSLQWIKNNITSFGGDPDNVTLLGSSSGAISIHALMLSPSAQGLFHKAVLMGAYLFMPVIPIQEKNKDHAFQIAKLLGFSGSAEDKSLLSFLKKQNACALIECHRQIAKNHQSKMAPVLPVGIFLITLDQGDVLPTLPRKLIPSIARIPIMMGFCERESIMGFTRDLRSETEKNFKTSLHQNCWSWGNDLNDEEIEFIFDRVQSFYNDGRSLENAHVSVKEDIQTDIFISDAYETLLDVVAADLPSSVFIYKFQFDGDMYTMRNVLKTMLDEELEGTFHACDFSYWNRFSDPGDKTTQEMVEMFTKCITTFARTGNPNYDNIPVEWKPTTPENPCYLNINETSTMVEGRINNEKLKFWCNIKKHFGKQ